MAFHEESSDLLIFRLRTVQIFFKGINLLFCLDCFVFLLGIIHIEHSRGFLLIAWKNFMSSFNSLLISFNTFLWICKLFSPNVLDILGPHLARLLQPLTWCILLSLSSTTTFMAPWISPGKYCLRSWLLQIPSALLLQRLGTISLAFWIFQLL